LRTADFDFQLPEHLIAQHPPERRGASRLLHVNGAELADRMFAYLPQLLHENDLLVLNDTRVLKARLFGSKESGGKVEVLVERVLGEHEVLAQVRASKSPKAGSRLMLNETLPVSVLGRSGEFFHLRFEGGASVIELLDKYGSLPLPPYIRPRTKSATRPCLRANPARSPRPRPGCISTTRCWKHCAAMGCARPALRYTSGLAPSSRCGWRIRPTT
jgi:S-adenosylmethionine:tRNA ribosyltransferase-isomerase